MWWWWTAYIVFGVLQASGIGLVFAQRRYDVVWVCFGTGTVAGTLTALPVWTVGMGHREGVELLVGLWLAGMIGYAIGLAVPQDKG